MVSNDNANDSMNVDLNGETSMSVDVYLNANTVSMCCKSECELTISNSKTNCNYCNKSFININKHKICLKRDSMNAVCSSKLQLFQTN